MRWALLPAAVCGTLSCSAVARLSGQLAATDGALLGAERIAALPAALREAWVRYLEVSRQGRARDRRVLAAELEAAGKEQPTPAPHGRGFFIEQYMTEEWFRSDAARRTADAIVSFQTPTGGWSKRLALTRPRQPGESWASEGAAGGEGRDAWRWIGTFDNGATTVQMRFLARAFGAHHDDRYRDAFLKGLEYILLAQFPSGCWPQTYPLEGSYHDAATFNDDAMVNVLRLLQDIARGAVGFVPEGTRDRARSSLRRGIDCVLASQVVVEGRRTAWGQQHDPLNLAEPVKARAYEPAALAGRESAAIVNFLMSLDSPDARVKRAVRDAVAWFRETAICGYEYRPGGELTPLDGAGPLWARFYEIGTNRPLFGNRDGAVRYSFQEVDPERRHGYAWYTDEPLTTLRRYEAWSRRHAAGAAGAQDLARDRC